MCLPGMGIMVTKNLIGPFVCLSDELSGMITVLCSGCSSTLVLPEERFTYQPYSPVRLIKALLP